MFLRTVKRRFLFPLKHLFNPCINLQHNRSFLNMSDLAWMLEVLNETAGKGQIMPTFSAPAETTAGTDTIRLVKQEGRTGAGPSVETLTFFVPASKSTEATAHETKTSCLVNRSCTIHEIARCVQLQVTEHNQPRPPWKHHQITQYSTAMTSTACSSAYEGGLTAALRSLNWPAGPTQPFEDKRIN